MGNKSFGLIFDKPFFQPGNISKVLGRVAALPAEKCAERAQAFKPDEVTNFGYADAFFSKQFLRGIESYFGEVLFGRFFIYLCEDPVKMKPGKKCLSGYLLQVDGFIIIFIDEEFRGCDALI